MDDNLIKSKVSGCILSITFHFVETDNEGIFIFYFFCIIIIIFYDDTICVA